MPSSAPASEPTHVPAHPHTADLGSSSQAYPPPIADNMEPLPPPRYEQATYPLESTAASSVMNRQHVLNPEQSPNVSDLPKVFNVSSSDSTEPINPVRKPDAQRSPAPPTARSDRLSRMAQSAGRRLSISEMKRATDCDASTAAAMSAASAAAAARRTSAEGAVLPNSRRVVPHAPTQVNLSAGRRQPSGGAGGEGQRMTQPLSTTQSYLLQRRTSAPPRPLTSVPTCSPGGAANSRDSQARPTALNDAAVGVRVSRTGFMERSMAAAVISAARSRSLAKKNRQQLPSKPPHHRTHGGFSNPWPSAQKESGMRSRATSGSRTFFKVAKDRRPPDEELATLLLLANKPDFSASADAVRRDKYALATTWFGHSTFYLHMRGLTILTDPVWSPRLGPLGPKRLVPPPCSIEELPPHIDVVLLSSSCYDHYDKNAIQGLAGRVGQWLVPLGMKSLLVGLGVAVESVVELDWWEEHNQLGCLFACTPAQHYSVREDTLWCSWVVHAAHHRVFYCGGTGYRAVSRDSEDSGSFENRERFGGPTCPAFREISHRYGGFDTAFLPIGGFKPRPVVSGIQGDALDMLSVHQDVGAKRSIAHRWGTFASIDEGMLDAVRALEFALQTGPVSEHEFSYLTHGKLNIS